MLSNCINGNSELAIMLKRSMRKLHDLRRKHFRRFHGNCLSKFVLNMYHLKEIMADAPMTATDMK